MAKSLIDNQRTSKVLCNCRNKENCPMEGMCNSEKVVFQASNFHMEDCKEEKVYIGISAGNWKQRFCNRHSFSNPLLRNQTSLTKWFRSLRDRVLTPQIKWRLIKKSSSLGSFNS